MEILLLGVAWSLLLLWMIAGQRDYLEQKQGHRGIDQSTSAYGGLIPLSVAGLLLGLTLAWAGPLKTLALIALVIIAGWAMQKIKKVESNRTLSSSALGSTKFHS